MLAGLLSIRLVPDYSDASCADGNRAAGPSEPLRLLVVVPSYWPAIIYGGPIFSIHDMCRQLAMLGVLVRVATSDVNGSRRLGVPTNRPLQFAENYEIVYYRETLLNRFSLSFMQNLGADIERARIVHLQDVFSLHAAWAVFQCWWRARPILISPRGVFSGWALRQKSSAKWLWLNLLFQPWVRDTRRVRFHATSLEEEMDIKRLFPRHIVYHVPNGVDLGTFAHAPTPRREEYLRVYWPSCPVPACEATIAVGLGRLHRKKAFDVAIEAIDRVRQSRPNLVLLIAGPDDGDLVRLQSIVRNRNLESRVHFVGPLEGERKSAFLKGADLFLFPSHSENFGLACLEALAAGLPVVASRETPWRYLEEVGAGKWVENTPEAFAEAIAALLSASSMASMGRAALRLAQRFDLRELANRLAHIYAEMVDARKPA